MDISDHIRKERGQRGWTQAELARRIPIGQQTVSSWERGMTRPGREQAKRLLELFEVDPDQLEVWLDLGDGSTNDAVPPARPLNPVLPIGTLSPSDFERFCRLLVQALHPAAEVHRFGENGDRQYGIDLYAQEPSGEITTYQCKRYASRTSFGPAKVRAAVTSNAVRAKHHYILLTRTATAEARKVVLGNPDWSLLDLEDIAEMIRTKLDANAQVQLVKRFFPNHLEDFLGIPEPGPWLTAEEFFVPFDDQLKLLNHTWSLVGRQQEVDTLTAFSARTDGDRLALVIGAGGSGKSRLLRAMAASLKMHPEIRVCFLLTGTAVDAGLVDQLPEGRSVLVIDDAHETPALEALLHALSVFRPEIRVILATRPYGVAHIRAAAQRANLADEPVEVELTDLSLPQVTALAAEVLQAEGYLGPVGQLADNIALLTRDCPLATVIGARLVARGQIPPNALASDRQFRDRLMTSFREVFTEDFCGSGERDLLDSLLHFFALLQPLVPDDPGFDELLQRIVGKSRAELKRLLTRLEDAGVLVRRGGMFRLVPDVLADVIAESACIDKRTGQPTGYVDELFDQLAGKALQNLLVNVGKLDWRLSSTTTGTPRARLLYRVWAKMDEHLGKSGLGEARRAILVTIADIAFYQPERALELAAQTIRDAGLDRVAEGQNQETEGASLIPALVTILRNVSYTYEYFGSAVDLLWTLAKRYRPDAGASSDGDPLRALQQIAGFGPGKPARLHEVVIERALGWLDEPLTPAGPSPFDVLDALLATEGTEDSYDDHKVTMRGFLVNANVVRPFRELVIEAAFAVLENGPLQDAVRALKSLEHALRLPVGLVGMQPNNEQLSQWDQDHLAVLKRLADLVNSTPLEPLLYVEIRRAVRWHAVNGQGETQAGARHVLDCLPTDLQSRVTRCLIEGYTWAPDDPSRDFEAAERHHQQYQSETVDQLLRDVVGAGAVVEYVRDRLNVILSVKSDRSVIHGPFLASLIERDSNVAREVIRRVLANPTDPLGQVLSVALSRLALTAPTDAVEGARQLLAIGNVRLDQQIGHAFSLGLGTRGSLHADEINLIESLAQHPDPYVRLVIVHAADKIAVSSKARAVRFLLSIDFRDSAKVAAAVLGEFTRHEFGVGDLGPEARADLLTRLEVCPSLNEHEIGLFLRAIALDDAETVVVMLKARIDRQVAAEFGSFEGLPFPWRYVGQSPVILRDNPKFERVLGQLLDWLRGADALQAGHKTPLIRAIVGNFNDPVIAAVRSWLRQHPDKESLEAVSLALSEAECSIVWTQQDLVVEIIRAAEAFGKECQRTVGLNLAKSAMSNSGLGASLDGQAASERELATNARKIASELPPGSAERRFYRELGDHAERMMQWLSSFHSD